MTRTVNGKEYEIKKDKQGKYITIETPLGLKNMYIWVNGDGLVENPKNIDKTAQISGNAQVYGNARVSGNARVKRHLFIGKWDALKEYFTLSELEMDDKFYYAYKTVGLDYENSIVTQYGKIKYEVGKSYKEEKVDTNTKNNCGAGLNVGTLMWCLTNNQGRILLVQISKKDNQIIVPDESDGKFRVSKLKVIREIKL